MLCMNRRSRRKRFGPIQTLASPAATGISEDRCLTHLKRRRNADTAYHGAKFLGLRGSMAWSGQTTVQRKVFLDEACTQGHCCQRDIDPGSVVRPTDRHEMYHRASSWRADCSRQDPLDNLRRNGTMLQGGTVAPHGLEGCTDIRKRSHACQSTPAFLCVQYFQKWEVRQVSRWF
jgi:hypothetical protein